MTVSVQHQLIWKGNNPYIRVTVGEDIQDYKAELTPDGKSYQIAVSEVVNF